MRDKGKANETARVRESTMVCVCKRECVREREIKGEEMQQQNREKEFVSVCERESEGV